MATAVSGNLSRAIRRGSVATTPSIQASPMSGAFHEGENIPAVTSSDAVFSSLFSANSSLDAPADIEVFESELYSGDSNLDSEINSDGITPSQEVNKIGEKSMTVSRADRFKSAGSVVAVESVRSAPLVNPIKDIPSENETSSKDRPWKKFSDPNSSLQSVSVKKSMSAAKVLTPLVAAVSFHPGNEVSPKEKAKALSDMLISVHRSATDTAEAISAGLKTDVPSWMVTQLMQNISLVVANRWEKAGAFDLDEFSKNLVSFVGSKSEDIGKVISAASEDAYIEVKSEEDAKFRLGVSSANAAWVLYDWVTNAQLMIRPEGDMPSRFFTYKMDIADLVNKLLIRCISESRALIVQVDSADMRVSHLQSSIYRMANLVGAEYVTQTRKTMNWISDPKISEEEYKNRYDLSLVELETKILPLIFEYARVNFLRIEQGAFRAIEALNEKENISKDGNSDGTRPAS